MKLAFLNVPLEKGLQTLAVGIVRSQLTVGSLLAIAVTSYLITCTRFWWLILLYIIWIYHDRNIHENGGRPLGLSGDWTFWTWIKDYFSVTLKVLPGVHLDPSRNYIFGCYPHGILASGACYALSLNASNYKQFFPSHTTRFVTLPFHFIWPFYREMMLALGCISGTFKALSTVLSKSRGGNIVTILLNGASGAYYCQQGRSKIILKSRKGFVTLALKYGTPIVPVFTFGETDLCCQVVGPTKRPQQDWYKNFTGMASIKLIGLIFLQYFFGISFQRRPLTVLVGKPLEFEKTENPTMEQIDKLHARFMEELVRLFEDNKHLYLNHAENVHLEIF